MSAIGPLDPGARRAIVDAAASLEADTVALLDRLVRHPSLLGDEASCLDEMEAAYAAAGLQPRRVPVDVDALQDHPGWSPPLVAYGADRANVAALHQPREARGRSLMLQGHVDVVPTGAAELWTSPPFEPRVADGRMYGRGAGDMKAGLAAIVTAWRALRLAGLQPAAPVQFAAVIEEECTGNGALAVMEALPKVDACVIPEPGQGYPALYVAGVGVVWAWVTITGRPTHVREMKAGVNAIDAAYAVAEHFRAYEEEMNRAEHRHPSFAADNHPINVNLGTIEGGEWNSSVPSRARIGVRVGVMPGRSCRQVRADIERLVAGAANDPKLRGAHLAVEFKGFMADGAVFPAEQPVARAVSALHREVAGAELRHWAVPALTDARFYALYGGAEATCYGPEADMIHGIDESVGLASVHHTAQVLALLMAEWCGVERAP